MPSVTELSRAMQSRRTENPKTVLAFFATVLGLVLTAVVAAAAVLAGKESLSHLVPWVLGFGGLASVALVGGVLTLAVLDPSKLMLGQVTGTEYAEIQRVTLGDSRTGERTAAVVSGVGSAGLLVDPMPALELSSAGGGGGNTDDRIVAEDDTTPPPPEDGQPEGGADVDGGVPDRA